MKRQVVGERLCLLQLAFAGACRPCNRFLTLEYNFHSSLKDVEDVATCTRTSRGRFRLARSRTKEGRGEVFLPLTVFQTAGAAGQHHHKRSRAWEKLSICYNSPRCPLPLPFLLLADAQQGATTRT